MSENLSEDEINALLTSGDADDTTFVEDFLRVSRRISRVFSDTLSKILGKKFSIREPKKSWTTVETISSRLSDDLIDVQTHLYGKNNGFRNFYFNKSDAFRLINPIMGIEVEEIDESVLYALSDAFSQAVYAEVEFLHREYREEITAGETTAHLLQKSNLRLDSSIFALEYDIYLDNQKALTVIEVMDRELAEGLGSLLEKGRASRDGAENALPLAKAESVSFPRFHVAELGPREEQNLGLLMDVSVTLSVELGRTKWQLRDVLTIGEGSIVALDKQAGEPVDVLVNNNLIARGEVVVVDENFSVRITEIITSLEQMVQKGL